MPKIKKHSSDALDHRAVGKPSFSRKDKIKYARKMIAEGLVKPPKNGLADFLVNPALLPKKPPIIISDEEE